MTGDTAFAERPPEASFDFWQPPRMASQIQRTAQRHELALPHVLSYVPPWPGTHKSRLKLSTRAGSRHKLIRSHRRARTKKEGGKAMPGVERALPVIRHYCRVGWR